MSRGKDRSRAIIHPRDRDCESCGAAAGYPCRTQGGKELGDIHCTIRVIGRWPEPSSESPDGEERTQPAPPPVEPGTDPTAGGTPQQAVSPAAEEAYPIRNPESRPAKTCSGNRRKHTAGENQPALF